MSSTGNVDDPPQFTKGTMGVDTGFAQLTRTAPINRRPSWPIQLSAKHEPNSTQERRRMDRQTQSNRQSTSRPCRLGKRHLQTHRPLLCRWPTHRR